MNIVSLFNMLVAISQQNHDKVTIESLKDAIAQSNMPSENKEVFKSYIDLGYDFFEERNHDKAKSECLNLMRLIDRCQKH